MNKSVFNFLIGFLSISILIEIFGLVNTMVSLKYETENLNDCVSIISGINLCSSVKMFEIIIVINIILIIGMIFFKKTLIKIYNT